MRIILALVSALFLATSASAQSYPQRDVTLVISFAPGGSNDIVGRYLANELSKKWGRSVVVENRAGAGSAIGTAHVAKATPDGHTLLLTSSAYTTLPAIQKDLPYDPETDLAPIAMVGYSPLVIGAGSRVKSNDLQGFIEEAKTREAFLGTAGLGSATHFGGELFNVAAGLSMEAVHYKGGSAVLVDVIGGRTDIYVGTIPTMLSQIEAGEIKALAIMADERLPALPDVPTAAEAGVEGAESALWWGVFAPAGTPDDIVQQVNADIIEVMSTPEATDFLAKQSGFVRTMSPEEFKETISEEIGTWQKLADERGIKPE